MGGLGLIACSGPGAGRLMLVNEMIALALAVTVGCLGYESLRVARATRGRTRYPIACLVILLFHPAWTVGAGGGDCGTAMVAAAAGVTLVASLAVARQVRVAVRARKTRDSLTAGIFGPPRG